MGDSLASPSAHVIVCGGWGHHGLTDEIAMVIYLHEWFTMGLFMNIMVSVSSPPPPFSPNHHMRTQVGIVLTQGGLVTR